MNNIDLTFYLEEPELSSVGEIQLMPLAPLSMVSSQPGIYFRSELKPTSQMLYGLCENALGWHFHDKLRKEILKNLSKAIKKKQKGNEKFEGHPWLEGIIEQSDSGYFSLLQHHLKFEEVEPPESFISYDDLWSMANRANSINFVGGSRNYDHRLEDLINLSKSGQISFGDRKEYETYTLDELRSLYEGQVKVTALSPYYPMYYSSPRKRGYVDLDSPYFISIKSTQTVTNLLKEAFSQPTAPLYLGHSEGWVDVKWIDND